MSSLVIRQMGRQDWKSAWHLSWQWCRRRDSKSWWVNYLQHKRLSRQTKTQMAQMCIKTGRNWHCVMIGSIQWYIQWFTGTMTFWWCKLLLCPDWNHSVVHSLWLVRDVPKQSGGKNDSVTAQNLNSCMSFGEHAVNLCQVLTNFGQAWNPCGHCIKFVYIPMVSWSFLGTL